MKTIKNSHSRNLEEEILINTFIMDFPCCSAGKESTSNAGDPGSIPGSGRSVGEGIGYQL